MPVSTGRGDMIPPTNSELKHQHALRAAHTDPSLVRASTGNPTDVRSPVPPLRSRTPACTPSGRRPRLCPSGCVGVRRLRTVL